MNIHEEIHRLQSKGFLCEIISDGWANWEFKDGKPDYKTATPSGYGVCWRGCFIYFNKNNVLVEDDIGCYSEKSGGINKVMEELIKTYESLKDEINPDGFKEDKE